MTNHRVVPTVIAALGALLCADRVAAQYDPPTLNDSPGTTATSDETAAIPPAKSSGEFKIDLGLGGEYRFSSGIVGGGDSKVWRAGIGVLASMQLNPDLKMRLGIGYRYDSYDFSGDTDLTLGSTEPWDDVSTLRFGALFSFALTNDWEFFVGPFAIVSGESGAGFGDSWSLGGVIGASVEISNDLTLGGGLAIRSKVERGYLMSPIIIVNWQITNDLRIATSSATTPFDIAGTGGRSILELVWAFAEDWEVAAGGGYYNYQWRLDDDAGGAFPNGVGYERSWLIGGRLSYEFAPRSQFTFFGGITIGGEYNVDDNEGSKVYSAEFDDAPFVGAAFNFVF